MGVTRDQSTYSSFGAHLVGRMFTFPPDYPPLAFLMPREYIPGIPVNSPYLAFGGQMQANDFYQMQKEWSG